MKPPIILEQLFKKRGSSKINWEWVKYTFFVLIIVATVGTLVYTVVQSIRTENFNADKNCAVAYGSTKWSHSEYDPNPSTSGDDMVKECVNSETKEKKAYHQVDEKSSSGVKITITHKDGQ